MDEILINNALRLENEAAPAAFFIAVKVQKPPFLPGVRGSPYLHFTGVNIIIVNIILFTTKVFT